MSDPQTRKPIGKELVSVVISAIVVAVVVTLIQVLLIGKSNPAVTGGIVGALIAVMAIRLVRKSSDAT